MSGHGLRSELGAQRGAPAGVSATRSQPAARLHRRARARHPAASIGLALCLVAAAAIAQTSAQTEPTQSGASQAHAEASTAAPSTSSGEPTSQPAAGSQQHKLRPINFTLVDELFHATVNESELVRRWRSMDGQFQDGIRSILKLVFPQIVAISQDAKVSGDCSGGILKWILSLRNLRSWAIKMLDASGKPTAGIFEGSLTMFGNHRQCLNIQAPDEDEIEITEQFEEYFRGQFCVLHLRPWLTDKKPFYHLNTTVEPLLRKSYKYYEKTLYDELAEIATAFNFIDIRMDLCVPSTCTTADIQRVADLLSKKLEMRAKVMRCDILPRESGSPLVNGLDRTAAAWLLGPACLLAATLAATLLVCLRGRPRDATSERAPSLRRLLWCMSLQGAWADLLAARAGSDAAETPKKPAQLYGLRNLFVLWFVVVQLTVELKYQYLRESLVLRNMMLNHWPFQLLINTGAIFESLILIAAFTFGYKTFKTGARGLLGYIANKYARLVPSIATLVALTIVLPAVGVASPVWMNFVEGQSGVCKSTGYLDLFFLQNLVAYDKLCLPHSWLFCVELQLTALSIPLVLLLQQASKRRLDSSSDGGSSDDELKRIRADENCHLWTGLRRLLTSRAGFAGVALLLAGAACNFLLVYANQLPPAWFHTFPDADQKSLYFGTYLIKAPTHLTSFLVGLYAGHLARWTCENLANQRPVGTHDSPIVEVATSKTRRANLRQASLQLAALACLVSTVFVTYSWSTKQLPTPLVAALYDSGSRLVWSIALAGLMVQLCLPSGRTGRARGLAGPFSHPVCVVLGRLSFLAYLIAPVVHTFVLAVQEQSLFPSLYLIFHVMLGNIVITYLLAFALALLIERPIWLVAQQLSRTAAAQSSGCATISEVNTTTNTSATSLAG